jgi:hypothetical protein
LAVFAAAPVHDIDHPGNNNAWEVATKSELAIRYNDTAVLENHHAAVALDIMKTDSSNIFGTLSADQLDSVHQTFVFAILQTDMAQHFKMVDRLKELNSPEESPPFKRESIDDKRFVVGCLLHSVDISNPCLPDFDLTRKWAERINEEFLNQYRNEMKLGLPVTKLWADLDTAAGFYKSQVTFIDFIVAPVWHALTDIFSDVEANSHLRGNLADNRACWEALAETDQASQQLGDARQGEFRRAAQQRLSSCSLPLDDLLDFGLNSFVFGQREMCTFYVQIMQFLGCQQRYDLPTLLIMDFITEVRHRYRMVPYHNLTHAFSITQFLFATFLKSGMISDLLLDIDILVMFTAAPVHDMDHPGNNNAWEVSTKSELAIRYNDSAVLENHHSAVALDIMKDGARNMFGTLPLDQLEQTREWFVYAILQTDMAQHFKMVDRLKELHGEKASFSGDSPEDRRYVLGCLLHCVDISNPLLPSFELTRKWAERINEEFMNQYKNELKLGLPETKMWATLNTNLGFYKSQVGFIDYIVSPLWMVLTDVFADLQTCDMGASLTGNRTTWLELADQEQEDKLLS